MTAKADTAIIALKWYDVYMRICSAWIPRDVEKWRRAGSKESETISLAMMRRLERDGFVKIEGSLATWQKVDIGRGLWRKRRDDESPVAFHNATGCVDDNFMRVWRGWYYCNPAHCHHRWRSKKERDKHLNMAYEILA